MTEPAWLALKSHSSRSWFVSFVSTVFSLESAETIIDLAFAEDSKATVLKHDRTTTVVVVDHSIDAAVNTNTESAGAVLSDLSSLVIKRYNARSVWHHVSRSVRRTRAARCWQMSRRFAELGVHVAMPVFALERRVGFLRTDAYFVAEKVRGHELLSVFETLDEAQRQAVVNAVQGLFSVLSKHRLSHGDLKASNLLWDGHRLWVIDLDAAQAHRTARHWRKAHSKDRRRFLKNWADSPELAAYFKGL